MIIFEAEKVFLDSENNKIVDFYNELNNNEKVITIDIIPLKEKTWYEFDQTKGTPLTEWPKDTYR